jgi:hypothetical protein
MDFPVFLNKWIIGFSPIKHTIFWYWYRLINHSDYRLDDHIRSQDFWEELNIGSIQMRDQYIMKQPGFDPWNLRGRK